MSMMLCGLKLDVLCFLSKAKLFSVVILKLHETKAFFKSRQEKTRSIEVPIKNMHIPKPSSRENQRVM